MGAGYVVTAGYVTVETAVPGGRAAIDVPRGAVLPADVPAEQVETLLRLGDIGEVSVKAAPEPAPSPPDSVPGPADGTVPDVLGRVGDDKALAQVVLDAEQAKGDKARTTLVTALVDIINRQPAD